jgi:hypothetical protein
LLQQDERAMKFAEIITLQALFWKAAPLKASQQGSMMNSEQDGLLVVLLTSGLTPL